MHAGSGGCGRRGAGGSRLLVIGAGLLAVGLPWADPAAAQPEVAFSRDVAPIFQQKCQECHRPDSMAPMSLLTYAESRPWARAIRARVAAREMPPWFLDKTVGIQRFINDISLSDAELDTIIRWVDAGAPEGDPADMPPPLDWPSGDRFRLESELGPPDVVVRSVPFTMPAVAQDVFFRTTVDVPLTEPRWIRAAETKPSGRDGRRIAHHASTYLHQAESQEFLDAERALLDGQAAADAVLRVARERVGGDSLDTREMLTEWAQGKGGEHYPENTGKLVLPGARVEFSIHYHAVGEEITDQLEAGWWFYPKDVTPKYSASFISLGSSKARGRCTFRPTPRRCTRAPIPCRRPPSFTTFSRTSDGRRELLNHADRFSNDWHINYVYDPDYAPVLPGGTVLQITAWHDNTAANRNNPDPRQWVWYGPRTVDEMAHSNTQIIFIGDDDYERISAERLR